MQPVNSAKHVDVRGIGLSLSTADAGNTTHLSPTFSFSRIRIAGDALVVVGSCEYPTRPQKHYVGQAVLDSPAFASAHWSVGLGQRHEWTF